MAQETQYQIVYRAAADFSALAREAAKAKAILKAMREEEEKANKVSLQDQDRIEKARTRARKALEAQNMAATVSARISREMAERGKREAETVRDLAKGSEAAARQINKLADAYKKLNSAASGEGTSSSSRDIAGKGSFAAVTAKELEKVRNNLIAYNKAASDTSDTNTRLANSNKQLGRSTNEVSNILDRLRASTKAVNESTTEVSVTTKNYGDIIETTTRRVHNAGTEAERIVTTVRRVTKETDQSGRAFGNWAGGLLRNMRTAWREAEDGVSVFARLRRSMSTSGDGRGSSTFENVSRGLNAVGNAATKALAALAHLPRAVQLAIGIAAIFEPAVAVLGSLGAVALGAANSLASLSGVLAAIPGIIAAAGTAAGALFVSLSPVKGVFEQFKRAQQEAQTTSASAGRTQKDNAAQIRSAVSGVRTAMNSLASANDGLADANRNLTDANKDLKRAQEDVNEAFREAKKDLADLQNEVKRGALDEEGAILALARAKEDQLKTNRDLRSSDLDRQQAALNVKQAEQDLADVRQRNKENQDDLNESLKEGIDHSDKVVSAQERLSDAERKVELAQRGIVDARRRVADAELDLVDAKRRLAEASIVENSAAGRATTQQDRYKKMLDALSPSAQKFVKGLLDMQEAWKGVQRNTQESFFARLVGDMGLVRGMLPVVENLLVKAGDALGEVAHKGILMMSSGPWKADFKTLAKDNAVLIRNMGDAGLSVVDAFRNITMAAAPFTKWVTSALKEGAQHFASWSKQARADGSIKRFLEEAKDRMQQMWQITKNFLGTLKSWNTASGDFGKWMLDRLEALTKRWREVAKAQEETGSPLRKYLEDVKPVLSAVGSLVGAVAAGFAQITADPENMQSTIKLLTSLEKDVLPPLLDFLDKLNDSGISVTVSQALGKIFEALAKFLDSGGGQAIATFVNVFAFMVDVFAELATMPVIGDILGHAAIGIAAIAGVLIAAKFTMLFKLIEGFKWIIRNGKTVHDRFKDIGDGVNSAGGNSTTTTTTTGGGGRPGTAGDGNDRPSTGVIPGVGAFSPVSDQDLSAVRRNLDEFRNSAQRAGGETGRLRGAFDRLRGATGLLRGGLSSVVDFLGGPVGVAIAAATILIGGLVAIHDKEVQRVKDTKDAYEALGGAYDDLKAGNSSQIGELSKQNDKFKELIDSVQYWGLSLTSVSGALKGNKQDLDSVNTSLDERLIKLDQEFRAGRISQSEYTTIRGGLLNLKNQINETSGEQAKFNSVVERVSTSGRTYKERLGGMTEAQVGAAQTAADLGGKIDAVSGFLDTMASSSSTAEERAQGLRGALDAIYGAQISANEGLEDFHSRLLDLRDSVKEHGNSLDVTTRSGLANRDAIEAAAKATRDDTVALISSGTPYEDAIKKHNERITALRKEAKDAGLNKEETEKLIAMYGLVPGSVETNVGMTGYEKAYEDLKNLKIAQLALSQGIPVDQAAKEYNKQRAKVPSKGDHTGAGGLATGGPVWGAGSKTSDSIPAWLSNGEFVQKADAVDYYGHGLMGAINSKSIKREVLQTAALLSKGPEKAAAERDLDPMFASGGAVRLASGGFAQVDHISQPRDKWPFNVGTQGFLATSKKLFEKWKKDNVGSGDASIGGWKNMWNWVHTRFPYTSLMSGFRKGDPLYHGKGKAIDIGVPDKFGTGRWWDVFRGIKGTFFKNIAELIWDFAGNKAVWNGREHFFHGPKSGPGTHRNHIHFAMKNPAQAFAPGQGGGRDNADKMKYADGGLVDLLNFSGLASPSMTSAPRTNTSSLSRAAQSVVNNTNGGMNFGDVIINNPLPERSGDSVRNAVLRTAFAYDPH